MTNNLKGKLRVLIDTLEDGLETDEIHGFEWIIKDMRKLIK